MAFSDPANTKTVQNKSTAKGSFPGFSRPGGVLPVPNGVDVPGSGNKEDVPGKPGTFC